MNESAAHKEVFEAELGLLNTAQREAVDTLEGPVMVIAGPGTGKTQILAARIGKILQDTDANPENILCLTYTEAGTVAMRKRLLKFIGPEAYKVSINTFHSFCNNVIRDNLDLFGIRALDSISELEQVELYQNLIDSFGKDHPLKRWTGDVYYEMGRLQNLFRIMKREDWTSEAIEAKIEAYLADLPERDEYRYKRGNSKKDIKAGDLNTKKLEDEQQRMILLQAAAAEFPNYQEMMRKRRRYDFDDMILLVLDQFKNNPDLLRTYQEQFQYFLVDEYQDTNGSQNELLHLLIDYWERPNVFVVGDDDQSIFRFQGANVENILEFSNQYRNDLKLVVMTENYRSSQHILDAAQSLIELNEERLITQVDGLTKNLLAKNETVASLAAKPVIRTYHSSAQEVVHIAQEIERLQEQGEDLGEIAVIYRNHRQSEDIARYLESRGIPVNIRRRANILELPFTRNLLNVLRYLEAEAAHPGSREDLLFELLHYDFFAIDPLVIAKMTLDLRNQKRDQNRKSWREMLRFYGEKGNNTLFQTRTDQSYVNIKQLSDNIEYWISQLHNTTLQVLVEKLITRGGILTNVMQSAEKFWLMQELSTMFEFIKDESVKNPQITLNEFIRTVENMQDHKIALPIHKTTFHEHGVNFITAHSSKGLEFKYVYLIGCLSKEWDKAPRWGTYKFPDNMVAKLDGDEVEESRRLFFVAMTRCKQNLYLSHALADNAGKDLEKSRFIAEIEELPSVQAELVSLPDEDLLTYNAAILKEARPPELIKIEEAHLRKILENYSLSVTHLNAYLKCPISFYFNYMLRVPMAKNQYMAFGSAVHFALEKIYRRMMDTEPKVFPPASELVQEFEWYMYRHRDSFTEEEFKRRLAYGQDILPKYHKRYVNEWNTVVTVERNFRAVVEEVPINGKLDKLEFDGTEANVVDYKTGQYKNNTKRFGPPATEYKKAEPTYEELNGGDYWRQAVFYKILVDRDAGRNWIAATTEFDFVEPDTKTKEFNKMKIHISGEDMDIVTSQIRQVYQDIQDLKFSEGCGEENCKWCNFVNSNYTLDLSELPQEEVDVG